MDQFLFLVDDDRRNPFYDGVPDSFWQEYGFAPYPIPAYEVSEYETYVEGFHRLIRERSGEADFYVIADGHFKTESGEDPLGGAKLLDALRKDTRCRFVRGCIYSVDPVSDDAYRSLTVLLFNRSGGAVNSDEELAKVCRFLQTGEQVVGLGQTEIVSSLSAVIHSLKNILNPVQSDGERLSEKGVSPDEIDEVWNAYLGDNQQGYLGSSSMLHHWRQNGLPFRGDITAAFRISVLDAFRGGEIPVDLEYALKTFEIAVKEARKSGRADLAGQLQRVAKAGYEIISVLRRCRDSVAVRQAQASSSEKQ